MNSAKDSIADRLFEWSQKQLTFEASSVFNRLSLLPSNEAHAFVALYHGGQPALAHTFRERRALAP